MAALTSSAVSAFPTDIPGSEWPTIGKGNRGMYTRRLKLVLTGQGTAANPIPASALGFTKLLECSNLLDVTGAKSYVACVDPVNNIILVGSGTSGAPGDVTTTVAYITVSGIVSGWGPS